MAEASARSSATQPSVKEYPVSDIIKPNSLTLTLAEGDAPSVLLNGEDISTRITDEDFRIVWDSSLRTFYLTVTFPVPVA